MKKRLVPVLIVLVMIMPGGSLILFPLFIMRVWHERRRGRPLKELYGQTHARRPQGAGTEPAFRGDHQPP